MDCSIQRQNTRTTDSIIIARIIPCYLWGRRFSVDDHDCNQNAAECLGRVMIYYKVTLEELNSIFWLPYAATSNCRELNYDVAGGWLLLQTDGGRNWCNEMWYWIPHKCYQYINLSPILIECPKLWPWTNAVYQKRLLRSTARPQLDKTPFTSVETMKFFDCIYHSEWTSAYCSWSHFLCFFSWYHPTTYLCNHSWQKLSSFTCSFCSRITRLSTSLSSVDPQ